MAYEYSDLRLKKNITTYTPKQINVTWVTYEWREGDKRQNLGAIAQSLEHKHPEFVCRDPETDLKAINYTHLLISKVAELEHRIKMLESI